MLSCASVFSEMEKGFSHKPNKIAHQTKCYLYQVKKIWVWFMFPTSKLFIAVFLIQNNNNNNNNFFILGKQIYNKIVAKIIKNNRIPKIKQTKYNIINRTKMLNRLVFHLTDQYRVQQF